MFVDSENKTGAIDVDALLRLNDEKSQVGSENCR